MQNVYDYLLKELNLDSKSIICAGISGGPDSMALLDLLIKVKKELGLTLVVAHVNHNVRKESNEEEEYVRKFSKDNDLIFESMKIENIGDDNFENEARTIRYNFFDQICKKYKANYLMTAHHGDDLIETILMRIVRGSTLKGYSGFSKIIEKDEYTLVRPLITVTKDELVKYCEDNKVKYYIDKTNLEDIHTRNRYRKYVLPFLKSENKLVHEKFLKYSETLLMYNEYIEKEVKDKFNKVIIDGVLDINKFKELDELIQTKIIYNILEKIYGDDLLIITNAHVKLMFDLINCDKAQGFIHLPNNVKVIKSYDKIELTFEEDNQDKYEIEISDIVNLPNGKNIVVLHEEIDDNSNNIIRLSSKKVIMPLYVRTRRNGDKMEVKGMEGHKKVNDIFIDSKIKTKDRDSWPIVCDSENNVVWIPGLKKSKYDEQKEKSYDIILRYI